MEEIELGLNQHPEKQAENSFQIPLPEISIENFVYFFLANFLEYTNKSYTFFAIALANSACRKVVADS